MDMKRQTSIGKVPRSDERRPKIKANIDAFPKLLKLMRDLIIDPRQGALRRSDFINGLVYGSTSRFYENKE